MPRLERVDIGDYVYNVLNRGDKVLATFCGNCIENVAR